MTRTVLAVLAVVFIFSACNTYSEKNYKKYQGISYAEYEKERQRKEAEKVDVTGETVEETEIEAPKFDFEYDAFGNEIVESTNSTYGEAVVVMAAKKIHLGRDAKTSDMATLQKALDAAYQTAMKAYRPAGFTYAISPAGAVNPLAIVDVQCILSESSSGSLGKQTCDLFFGEITTEYKKAKDAAAN